MKRFFYLSIIYGFSIILFLSSYLFAQTQNFSGIIIDEDTRLPIPFASILQIKTRSGTVSNAKGEFSLALNKTGELAIRISSIGYKTTFQKLNLIKGKTIILLKSDEKQLKEVIIMPDSMLKHILSRAYRRIEDNYHQEPIELTGFYREAKKTKKNHYFYFGEATLKVQHKGYQYSKQEAQVEILKARITNFPSRDSIDNVKYYQGPFIANWGDFVKTRALFLNPISFNKNYIYTLEAISHYNEKQDTVYVIGFRSKSSEEKKSGRLWINKKTLAYLKIEFDNGKEYRPNLIIPAKFLSRKYQALYAEEEGKYLLKYVSMIGENFNIKTNKISIPAIEFTTTSYHVGESVIPIPFEKRLSHMSIFSMQSNNYDDKFWDSYDSIEKDSVLQSQINSHFTIQEARQINQPQTEVVVKKKSNMTRDKVFDMAQRVHAGYGLSINYHLGFSAQPLQLLYQQTPITRLNDESRRSLLPTYIFYTGFDLKKQWSIQIRSTRNLLKDDYSFGSQLNILKSYIVKKMGNPLFLKLLIGIGTTKVGYYLGDIISDKTIELDDKNLGKQTRVYLGKKSLNSVLGIELDYRKKRRHYFLTTQYSPILLQEDALFFRTRKNVFFKKNATVTNFSDKVSVTKGHYKGVGPISLTFGIGF